MSKLQQAFSQSRRQMSGRTATPQGNIVLKATEFTDKTVKGEVMTGPAAGQNVEIEVPDNGGKSVGIKEFTKKSHKAFIDTENGGTLRVERVTPGDDGVYKSRWMRSFNGQPKDNQSVHYDAVVSMTSRPSQNPDSPPRMSLNKLHLDAEEHVSTIKGLEDAIRKSFETAGGAHVFCDDGGEVISSPFVLGGQKVDGEWQAFDPAERAAEAIEGFGDFRGEVERILSEGGFSVVPSERMPVGPDTAEAIHETVTEAEENGTTPRISTIDPSSFKVLPIGVRTQIALNMQGDDALPKDAQDKLKARFLDSADDDAKAAFHKSGWRGVSDDDMRRFFSGQGVDLKDHGEDGWSRQTVLCLGDSIAIKSFGQNAGVPYPNVKACEDANNAFRTEVRDAISAVIEAPAKTSEAAKAPASDEANTDKGAAPAQGAGEDDLDAMLNGIEDGDLDDQAPA